MRFLADGWSSGERWALRDNSHDTSLRAFSTTSHFSACGCSGCISEKLAIIASNDPDGSDTRTGNGGPEEQNSGSDTIGNTTATTGVIVVDGTAQNGFVNTAGDDDWYAVTLVAGQSYTFTLIGGTLPDSYLELRDSAGTLIGIDDDFGPGLNALLRWTATTSGTYYINARGFLDTDIGSYALTAVTSAPASPLDSINYHFTMPGPNIAIWFATAGHVNPNNDTAMRNWTQTEIDAAFAALATFSAITPLTFTQAATQGAANWVLSLVDLAGNTLGYFSPQVNGYGAFDPTVANWTTGLVPGGNSFITLIHEFGHGLGLAHPHDNGPIGNGGANNSEIMQGVLSPFNSLGTFEMNYGHFTTMTYNDAAQSTPMGLDVALLQQRYGVNPNTGSGDTSYALALSTSSYRCIWDVGGTDTISYAGSGNATIDLRAATLLNAVGGGGYVSSVLGVTGGFTIANGVLIENATGGSGNDTLIGNDAANILNGGDGDDSMSGGGGNDTYFVGGPGDLIHEAADSGTDLVFAALSHQLSANFENLTLTGVAANGTGNNLSNLITGNASANTLSGQGGNDTLNGGANSDTLNGGDGVDTSAYAIASTSATWVRNPNGSWTVTAGAEGADTTTSVEFLDFTDRDVFLDRAYSTFSGDGTSDVFMRHSSGSMGVWFVNGSGVTGAAGLGGLDAAWAIEGVADFSGDGRDDIFMRHANGNLGVWFMNGASASGAAGLGNVDLSWDVAGLGDLNGDGFDDIVWWNDNGSLGVWFMNNGAVSGSAGLGNISQASWAFEGLGDFNGDGRDDILWRNSAGDTGIWFMDGGAATGAGIGNIAMSWAIEGVGDFNGDGRDDILMRDASGNLGAWFMNGASATGAGLGNVAQSFAVAAVGDYNGDGRDDILWWHDNGSLGAWFMNGASASAISYGGVSHDWIINPGG